MGRRGLGCVGATCVAGNGNKRYVAHLTTVRIQHTTGLTDPLEMAHEKGNTHTWVAYGTQSFCDI